MARCLMIAANLVTLALMCGCVQPMFQVLDAEQHDAADGLVIYLDGAGNLGFGVGDVPRGLRESGFRGTVEQFVWTTGMGVVTDHVSIDHNRRCARLLADRIAECRRQQPGAPVHLIGLSAGTGIVVFALEALPDGVQVDDAVLLGSSLSRTYDLRPALGHVRGRIFVYHSVKDAVLGGLVPWVGTVDRCNAPAVGLAGFEVRDEAFCSKLLQVAWNPDFGRHGYAGGHTDCVTYGFMRNVIAPALFQTRLEPVELASHEP